MAEAAKRQKAKTDYSGLAWFGVSVAGIFTLAVGGVDHDRTANLASQCQTQMQAGQGCTPAQVRAYSLNDKTAERVGLGAFLMLGGIAGGVASGRRRKI